MGRNPGRDKKTSGASQDAVSYLCIDIRLTLKAVRPYQVFIVILIAGNNEPPLELVSFNIVTEHESFSCC